MKTVEVQKLSKRQLILKIFFGFFILLIGYIAGLFIHKHNQMECIDSLHFVNPGVVCGKPFVIKKTGYVSTSNKIKAFIENEKSAGNITEGAVYFRDLVHGPVFGVNETSDFAPASLLKLPLALFYFSKAETNPEILQQELSVEEPKWSFSPNYPATKTINPKEPNTVEDLLMHMVTYSDNESYGVLQTNIFETGQEEDMIQTFLELGFLDPNSIDDEVLSVRQYASIFRLLFNVSFLSAEGSEQVLTWLEKSDFNKGLKMGIPNNIKIANKFGERIDSKGVKQLHDCGVIYYPDNPYLLCVMTKGDDFKELERVIGYISREVYNEFDSRKID